MDEIVLHTKFIIQQYQQIYRDQEIVKEREEHWERIAEETEKFKEREKKRKQEEKVQVLERQLQKKQAQRRHPSI
jgi:tRNA G10  N-methylase Trm11